MKTRKDIGKLLITIIIALLCIGGFWCWVYNTLAEPTEGDVVNSQVYIDKDTGVNYILFSSNGKCGVCPRYKADGTMYVSE